ncbi:MAG: glycogen synthase, partial [Candidatus Xenobia bacterium]
AHTLSVPCHGANRDAAVYERTFPDSERPVYLLSMPAFYDRPGVYGDGPTDYPDNASRFGFLCRGALEWLLRLGWQPDVVHAHDWAAAPSLVHLRTTYYQHPFFLPMAGVFTFQDLQYQGVFPPNAVIEADLPAVAWHSDALESWGLLNLLKGGIVFADSLTTVSPQYAREVQNQADLGLGLEKILAQRHKDLTGILKGVDHDVFDPETDASIEAPFSVDQLKGKAACRKALLAAVELAPNPRGPVFGVLSRLTVRRGLPVLLQVLPRLLEQDVRVIIAGRGDPVLEADIQALVGRWPDRIALIGYQDVRQVHRLYAGSDVLIRPSLHEPCGVPPMEALRYGTLPVVRTVGGYVDSMVDVAGEGGYAFTYAHVGPESLDGALQRALTLWKDDAAWQQAQRNAMTANFSWDRAAAGYSEVYEHAAATRRVPSAVRGVHR